MSQLLVDSIETRYIFDLQPPFLGEGDVSDTLVFGTLQVGLGGEAPIEAGLSRSATVQVVLALDPGLELIGIVGVSPHDLKIKNQSGDATGSGTACA